MTKTQAAARLNSQTACMLAEMHGMLAANQHRDRRGEAQAYNEQAFFDLPYKHQVDWNAAITLLNEAMDG